MADFVVRNSLNPYKAVKLNITFQQQVLEGEEGELFWLVEINTTEPDLNGDPIKSEYIHLRSLTYLDEEIQEAVSAISAQIDWSPYIEDTREPVVYSYSPSETSNVSIDSYIELVLKDILPSAGIDLSSINVKLNEEDITNQCEITGDPYEYKVKWVPNRVYETFS